MHAYNTWINNCILKAIKDGIKIYLSQHSKFTAPSIQTANINKQSAVFRFRRATLYKNLRHCSKLINRSLYRVSAPPSQRNWSSCSVILTPVSHPSQPSVLLPASSSMKLYKLRWCCSQRDTEPLSLPSSLTSPVCRVDTKERIREARQRERKEEGLHLRAEKETEVRGIGLWKGASERRERR